MFLLRGILLKHEPDTFNYATFVAIKSWNAVSRWSISLWRARRRQRCQRQRDQVTFRWNPPTKGGWWWFVNGRVDWVFIMTSTSYTSPRIVWVLLAPQLFVSPSLMQNSIHSPHQPPSMDTGKSEHLETLVYWRPERVYTIHALLYTYISFKFIYVYIFTKQAKSYHKGQWMVQISGLGSWETQCENVSLLSEST